MISRPVVAAPLAGLLLGDPVTGMWAGALLEILSLHQLPIGASRHWDTGPAAVVAAAAAVLAPAGALGALVLALGYGALVGWAGGWTMYALRRLNGRLVAGRTFSAAQLSRRHLVALGADFLRAAALTLLATVAIIGVLSALGDAPATLGGVFTWLLLACVALAVGVDVRAVGTGRSVAAAFAAGAATSAILALWLG